MIGMTIVNNFDREKCFWKTNPQFKTFEPFKTLYDEDKSKSKTESSMLMWGLAFYCDRESILKNLPVKYKRERILKEFGGIDLTLDIYSKYIEAFEELCLSEAERTLRVWEDKMNQRNLFVGELEYTIDNATEVDKILEKTPKLFIELQRLKDQVLSSSDGGKAMGGVNESASDRGEI